MASRSSGGINFGDGRLSQSKRGLHQRFCVCAIRPRRREFDHHVAAHHRPARAAQEHATRNVPAPTARWGSSGADTDSAELKVNKTARNADSRRKERLQAETRQRQIMLYSSILVSTKGPPVVSRHNSSAPSLGSHPRPGKRVARHVIHLRPTAAWSPECVRA